MNFKKRGELKRLLIFGIFVLLCFTMYMVFAQESSNDITSPTINSIASSENQILQGNSVTITVSATDDTEIDSVMLVINQISYGMSKIANNQYQTTIDPDILLPGTNSYSITATDSYGNTREESREVEIIGNTLQTSASPSGDVSIISINENNQEYSILDMDNDNSITEEDIFLRLNRINQKVTDSNVYLTYLNDVHGITFTLSPITISDSIGNSREQSELQTYLPTAREQLETLANQINGLQNAIGDLDQQDPAITEIKEYFEDVDYDISMALWYTGRG